MNTRELVSLIMEIKSPRIKIPRKICITLFFICFVCHGFESKITILDTWQKAEHVVVVQVIGFIHIPPPEDSRAAKEGKKWSFVKLRIKEVWHSNQTPSPDNLPIQNGITYAEDPLLHKDDIIHIFNSKIQEEDIGRIFIGSYGPKTTNWGYYGIHLNKYLNTTDSIFMAAWTDLTEQAVLKDEDGREYITGCIDGLTWAPLIDPPLEKIKRLSLPELGKPPSAKLVGVFWPAAEKTTLKVKLCGEPITKVDKFLRWITTLFDSQDVLDPHFN